MKRFFAFFLFAIMLALLCGCAQDAAVVSTTPATSEPEKLPVTPEEAIESGCLVMQNGTVTDGEDTFFRFLEKTRAGQTASLRLVRCFEPSSAGNPISDLFVYDITFSDDKFIVTNYRDTPYTTEFSYIVEDHHMPPDSATYGSATYYILCESPDITYAKIISAIVSSSISAQNEIGRYFILYGKYHPKSST